MPTKLSEAAQMTPAAEHKLKLENADLRRQLDAALEKHVLDSDVEDFMQKALNTPINFPKWVQTPRNPKNHLVMPVANLSDWHLDEVVRPEEIQNKNGYNRAIAERRVRYCFDNICKIGHSYIRGFHYPGIVVNMLGDNFSGFIHEELRRTNADSLMGSMLHWLGPVAVGLQQLADAYGKVWVTGVVGNHGRHDKKPIMKMRAQENFDWLFLHLIKTVLAQKDEKRIEFLISNGHKLQFQIFDTRVITSHGDECKGGSGIAGMLSPQLIAFSRMKKTYEFDQWWIGHWHTLGAYRGIRVNGCFTAGTLVQTSEGVKQISDIKLGDKVLSHNGNLRKVTALLPQTSDQGLVRLKVRGLPEPLETTPNHEIWAIKGETHDSGVEPKWRGRAGDADKPQWIKADFISPGDWVSVPTYPNHGIDLDLELAWAMGLYLAEGCSIYKGGCLKKINRIELTMHIDELPVLTRAKAVFDKVLGKEGRLFTRCNKTTSSLTYTVKPETALEWQTKYGHFSHGKCLPHEFLTCTSATAAALIQGWVDGDGHTRSQLKDNHEHTSATTVSRALAYAMFALSLKAGMRPSIGTLEPGGKRLRRSYMLCFNSGQESCIVDGQVFYRVAYRWRTNEVVPVYDLTVEGEHTYNAGLVGVHNSLKGYDEYASISNFDFQPPQQDFFLVAPRVGVTASWPIHCQLPDEPWAKKTNNKIPFVC